MHYKDAFALALVTFVQSIALAGRNVLSSPDALGHSADFFRVGRDCAVARPRKAAASSSQAARGTGRAAFGVRFDHRVSVAGNGRRRVARLGARVQRRANRLGFSGVPSISSYHRGWCRTDRDASVAQPAAHGAVGEPIAIAATGPRGAHTSAKHEGADSLLRVVGHRRIVRGILVSRICHGGARSRRFAARSGYTDIIYHFWAGAPLSGS